jgi:S-adenosylmethionine:tRNA ribosyltransferase-isomerase
MRLSHLDFELPEELIARRPLQQRDQSRLLIHHCQAEETHHRQFSDVLDYFRDGDLLVLNNSQVVPARMLCRKPTGGAVEGLWLNARADGTAECMLSGGRLRAGVELQFAEEKNGKVRLLGNGPQMRLQEKLTAGRWVIENSTDLDWHSLLTQMGHTPLPPYIRRLRRDVGEAEDSEEDRRRYQTVWAEQPGSVAAPTASLHFTAGLIQALENKGVKFTHITLHVGAGTFLPVETEQVESHQMHAEKFSLSAQAAADLCAARKEGRRIVAVGTTACRLLESLPAQPSESMGETDLFILPGHEFRWTDALITNFHTPKSTLLALVAAFVGQNVGPNIGLERVHGVYRQAIEEKYRFYSYGDASLWLK